MKIYNLLFYKGYQLAKKSRNFNDPPVLGTLLFIAPCVMFNIFTLIFLLQGLGWLDNWNLADKYGYIFSLFLVILLLAYYLYKGQYKRIIKSYENSESISINKIHPFIVFIFYYLVSFGLLLIAGMYKNNNWIFHNI